MGIIKQYHFNKTAELLTKYSNYVSFKYNLNNDEIAEDIKQFAESETNELRLNVQDDYKQFIDKNETSLDEQYGKEHGFQTSVRGLKVRGLFWNAI